MATNRKPAETAPESAQETRETVVVSQDKEDVVLPVTAEAVALCECFVVPSGGLRLREAPDPGAGVITILPFGCGVWAENTPAGEEWVRVQTGILVGYVMAEYLELMPFSELVTPDAGAE